jgi:hypothetical protein
VTFLVARRWRELSVPTAGRPGPYGVQWIKY